MSIFGMETIGAGTSLGKYLIRRELGRGGMGAVYLAEDTLLARDVAVKVLLPTLGRDSGFIARFREEARSVSRLLHPHIVHVNSFEPVEGQFVIDMEYVAGLSLDRFLAEHRVTPQKVLAIAADVLQGLAACHDLGIVHRDVKPTNILLTEQERAKLGDFGIARAYADSMEVAVSHRTSSGFFLGTPRYAPPELWDGTPPTPAWDVYSVGVVMYEALTGALPYDGATPFAIVKQMQSRSVTPLLEAAPALSDELSRCVHALLSADPAGRPANAAEALDLFRSVPELPDHGLAEAQTVRVARRPTTARARRRRRLLPIVAAGALVTAAVFAGCLFLFFYADTRIGAPTTQPAAATFAPGAQDTTAQEELLSKDQLLNRIKRSDGNVYLFFDTTTLETDERHDLHWMMVQRKEAENTAVVAATDRGLWYADVTSVPPNKLTFRGYWAEYRDNAGTNVRQGTLSGTGAWTAPEQTLTASLTFSCATDRTTVEQTVIASRHKGAVTDTAYLYALEQAPLVQPLLYHELLQPRHPWATQIEALLPCVEGARLEVPRFEATAEQLSIDGRFEEACWKAPVAREASTPGACVGVPTTRGAKLMARCLPEGLMIGVSMPAHAGTPTALELAWLPDVGIPTEASAYAFVRLPAQGSSESHLFRRDTEINWKCDWWTAYTKNGDVWQWEIFIPFKRPLDAAEGGPATPWRLNCAVVDDRRPEPSRVLVRWGFPELREVLH